MIIKFNAECKTGRSIQAGSFSPDYAASRRFLQLASRSKLGAAPSGELAWLLDTKPPGVQQRHREKNAMIEADRWRHMSTAPKDGSRISSPYARSSKDRPMLTSPIGLKQDQFGIEGWRAGDFNPGCVIGYADPELKCWMPLPDANVAAGRPSPWEGEDEHELDGSGI